MNNISSNSGVRFRYSKLITLTYLLLGLPTSIFVLSLLVYGFVIKFVLRFGEQQHVWISLLVVLSMIVSILFGIYMILSEASYIKVDEEGVTKYFLRWKRYRVNWCNCAVHIYPNITPYNRKRTMTLVFNPLDKLKKPFNFVLFGTVNFDMVNIEKSKLPHIIEILNYYILQNNITVHYKKNSESTEFLEIDQLPLPPYPWEGQPPKKRNNMDIKF